MTTQSGFLFYGYKFLSKPKDKNLYPLSFWDNNLYRLSRGVKSVPAVAINEKLVDCCKNSGIDMISLKEAGLGQ
jgi:hypothetical protein